jgi:two-component system phosphate regulon sensor histidine kinase PhoR
LWQILTRLPIKWRLTIVYIAIIWFSMTVAGLLLSYQIESQYTSGYHDVLRSHAALVSSVFQDDYSHHAAAAFSDETCRDLASKINARVQVFDTKNNLIADSSRSHEPEDPAQPLKSFSCMLCHPEARSRELMSVSQPLSTAGHTIGRATVSMSLFGVKQAAARTRRVILSALVIAAAIAAVLSQRLAFSIAKPITDISAISEKMATGDLSVRANTAGTDEVARLASSFNGMAMTIQKMLREMTDERDRMETILTTMADGIIITDKSGRVVLFNKASETIFARQAVEAIGQSVSELDLHPELAGMVAETLRTQGIVRKDLRLDKGLSISAYTTTVKDPPSDVEGAVVVLHDLTEIRNHERAQKDFVANVSHELRTPITAVRVTAEALLGGAKNDPKLLDRFLTNLVTESERLSALIDDLLEVAKLESGRLQARHTEVDLRTLTERVADIFQAEADRRGVRLECCVPEISVFADERQLEQVVANLTDNAIKYTPEGGSALITADEQDDYVSISVADTGIGIPQGDLPRIFERFYRVDKARSRQMGGTGLGLSIVKDIVDAHGGTISVQTRLNQGSTFTVTLRKQIAPVDAIQSVA